MKRNLYIANDWDIPSCTLPTWLDGLCLDYRHDDPSNIYHRVLGYCLIDGEGWVKTIAKASEGLKNRGGYFQNEPQEKWQRFSDLFNPCYEWEDGIRGNKLPITVWHE